MKNLKIVVGLTWAFACLILMILLFPALNPLANSISKAPFMKINPRYSGGEIIKEINKNGYSISIHRTVFDGLIGQRNSGFVQIDWRGKLPSAIIDTIDFDDDGVKDFIVKVVTATSISNLRSINPFAKSIELSTKTSYGWSVRVGLVKNPSTK